MNIYIDREPADPNLLKVLGYNDYYKIPSASGHESGWVALLNDLVNAARRGLKASYSALCEEFIDYCRGIAHNLTGLGYSYITISNDSKIWYSPEGGVIWFEYFPMLAFQYRDVQKWEVYRLTDWESETRERVPHEKEMEVLLFG